MIFWLLYLCIDGDCTIDYPYHFAQRETCVNIGKSMVKDYKYEAFRCVQEKRE